jgi:hypothetical protein
MFRSSNLCGNPNGHILKAEGVATACPGADNTLLLVPEFLGIGGLRKNFQK